MRGKDAFLQTAFPRPLSVWESVKDKKKKRRICYKLPPTLNLSLVRFEQSAQLLPNVNKTGDVVKQNGQHKQHSIQAKCTLTASNAISAIFLSDTGDVADKNWTQQGKRILSGAICLLESPVLTNLDGLCFILLCCPNPFSGAAF